MTQEELNYIKDSFSQILDDIGGNPDWYDAAKAVASDLGTMEKQLEERVTKLPSNLDEAAITQMEEDGDIDHFVRKGIYEIALKYARLGAEWMAEQFQKIDGSLDDWYETNDVEYCYGIRANEAFEVPEGFYIKKK